MKLKYLFPILLIALFISSCSSEDDDIKEINEVENYIKIQDIVNSTHTLELYNESGIFQTGYNNIVFRIKDNTSNLYIENASINWTPMMQMSTMQHSSPKSTITKVSDKETLFTGSVIYQMTGMNGSGWSLTFNYSINNQDYAATEAITVVQANKQNVTTFTGSDNIKYIAALITPTAPSIGINDITVGLYKMESMMSFPSVEDFSILLDPRMPSMGNHSSPNNTDLGYDQTEDMYTGDLSLTMTGYWILNLKLMDNNDVLLKGEDVTEQHTQSSLYLELEF